MLIDVCNRGAFNSEFIEYNANSGRTFVISSSNNQNGLVGHEENIQAHCKQLYDYARRLPRLGT